MQIVLAAHRRSVWVCNALLQPFGTIRGQTIKICGQPESVETAAGAMQVCGCDSPPFTPTAPGACRLLLLMQQTRRTG